jgi:hypothetical protein
MRILIETKELFVGDKDYRIFVYEDTEEMKYYGVVENTPINVKADTKSELSTLVEQALFR